MVGPSENRAAYASADVPEIDDMMGRRSRKRWVHPYLEVNQPALV